MRRLFISFVSLVLSALAMSAQDYPQIVMYESSEDAMVTFTSLGASSKAKNVQENAAKSLFYTLFYSGVEGVNDGEPLITKDNPQYVNTFLASRYPLYVRTNVELTKPEKNASKIFQGDYRITVVYGNLIKELERNGLRDKVADPIKQGIIPSIMVVPYKRDGETYASILESDFDRRIAVGKVQDGFKSRNVSTVDVEAKLDATLRNAQFGANDADSNDKQLIMNSGADVYVVVDVKKDVNSNGAQVSLILKAYETSTARVLASKDAITKRFANAGTDLLCSYAVTDNLQAFLDDICKNFSEQKIALQFALDGASTMTMNDRVGPNNLPLSTLIHQWVGKNSLDGKYHLQGRVDTSIIYDYVMIPPRDADGQRIDAAQFSFKLEEWLNNTVGVPCFSRLDGTTVYITIL